jgi:hypothetical protein
MKAIAKVYKGIEFININELPANQKLLIQHNAELQRIKILLDGKIVNDCIQFREYEQWYALVFKTSVPKSPVKEENVQVNVSLSKA